METRAQDLVATPADPSLPLREARKERTHRALLDAALVLTEQVGFASVSLRQVTKAAGIVPTAFYRHYDSMDALGETLVVESFGSLRKVIRAVRTGSDDPAAVITRSAEVLVSHVHTNRTHFRFIARERSGGVDALRRSIRHELEVQGPREGGATQVAGAQQVPGPGHQLHRGRVVELRAQRAQGRRRPVGIEGAAGRAEHALAGGVALRVHAHGRYGSLARRRGRHRVRPRPRSVRICHASETLGTFVVPDAVDRTIAQQVPGLVTTCGGCARHRARSVWSVLEVPGGEIAQGGEAGQVGLDVAGGDPGAQLGR